MFDGSEAGQHYTWDYLTVETSAAASVLRDPADEDGGVDPLLLIALPAAALALLGIVVIQRRRPTPEP